jgi:hypothetical protein
MKLSRFVSVMVVGAFVLAACGGGGSDTASPAAGGSTGSTGGSTGSTGGSTGGSVGGGGALDAAQCAQVVGAMSAAAAAVPSAMSGQAGDLNTSLAQLQAFAQAAPEEIRADLTLVYQRYSDFLAAMQDAGYDPSSSQPPTAEQIAAMEQASQVFQDADFQAASKRVDDWFKANCGN